MKKVFGILKFTVWLLVLVLIVCPGPDGVEGRRRNRKNRTLDKELKNKTHSKRRHHQRRRNSLEKKELTSLQIQQQLLESWQLEKTKPIQPQMKMFPQIAVEEWREAIICAHSKARSTVILHHRAVARVGHQSKTEDVVGKLVHISDPNMQTHYGCTEEIGNICEIPQNRPWIALVERGKCRFFNKIRLAKLHNASAVIIYNHEDKSEVMNTAGTRVMAMMVSKSDGMRLIELVDDDIDLEMKIGMHNDSCSTLAKDKIYPTLITTEKAPISNNGKDLVESIEDGFGLVASKKKTFGSTKHENKRFEFSNSKIDSEKKASFRKSNCPKSAIAKITPTTTLAAKDWTSGASGVRTSYLNAVFYFAITYAIMITCVK